MSQAKDEFLERTKQYWNPGKTADWQRMGVDIVIDRREAYYLYDMDGRRLIDVSDSRRRILAMTRNSQTRHSARNVSRRSGSSVT
jgi:hypothetical protein